VIRKKETLPPKKPLLQYNLVFVGCFEKRYNYLDESYGTDEYAEKFLILHRDGVSSVPIL
jgi:hypothetical protein